VMSDEERALRQRRPAVYIASSISAPTEREVRANVRRNLAMATTLGKLGFAPMAPAADYYWPDREFAEWSDWLAMDLPWVRRADAVLRLPGASRGADLEERVARRAGVPVFNDVESLVLRFRMKNLQAFAMVS
jgi:hypothetical protein